MIIDQVSYTTYVVWVNFFIYESWDLQFKTNSEGQIFEKHFIVILTNSEFLSEICWEEITERILFLFCFDVWTGDRTLLYL